MGIAKKVETLFTNNNLEDAVVLAQQHYANHENSESRDVLIAALDYIGNTEECFELTMEALRIRCEEPKLTYPALSREGRVMISGFFYSGSGAVLDHLRGYHGAVKWPPRGEYRYVKSPGGLRKFVDAVIGDGDFMEAVIDLYLNVSGAKILRPDATSKASWKTAIKASRNLQKNVTANGHQKELFQLVYDLSQAAGAERKTMVAIIRSGISRALDAAAAESNANMLLIDQAVNAFRLYYAAYFPPSVFLVVDRDPRDHFVETRAARIKRGEKAPEAHIWSKDHPKIREKYKIRRANYEKKYGHRFIEISFEDFVTDYEEQAGMINANLGILDSDSVTQHFDPQVSINNIGKHFTNLDDNERHVISSDLNMVLHPAAGKRR